jgi:rod shape-determining protein MreC
VVQYHGLVGLVIAVSQYSAKVLLITDPSSGVDALVQQSRARGVIEGLGGTECTWRFVLREEPIKIGDRIITSGMDGVFPKGVVVGVVAQIDSERDSLFHSIVVEPSVNLSTLEEVYILPPAIEEFLATDSERPLIEAPIGPGTVEPGPSAIETGSSTEAAVRSSVETGP